VFIGKDCFFQLTEFVNPKKNVLFLIDKNVSLKCSILIEKITRKFFNKKVLIINPTEKKKSIKTVEKICKYLSENHYDRDSVIISIGGGILGDIAGFVSSIYMRGIKYFLIPSTILSAVDSSVGGKTGVNFYSKKNLIGTFYQPDGVFINPDFFYTLPKKEILSGIGEMIKYALLVPQLYDFFYKEIKKVFSNNIVSDKLILTSIKIKASIVKSDEKEETGLRKILNLGHTFAHSFESAAKFRINHGQAVFYGIICALILSKRKGIIKEDKVRRFLNDFKFYPISKFIKTINSTSVLEFMKSDKKNLHGKISLVLPSDNEIIVNFPVEDNLIIETIEIFKDTL
jgi:3-dehydroquinate synthase